jgi:hypothetical protein
MYKKMYAELKSKKAGVYYATTWHPKYLEEKIRRKNIFDTKKLEFLNVKGKVKVEISEGDFIKFR